MRSKRAQRHRRVVSALRLSGDRPRLNVFRSHRHIYAQIIDDATGRTLVSCDDRQVAKSKNQPTTFRQVALAELVGRELARRALAKKVTAVAFDRGGYLYAGRVRSLAEGARAGGLKF